MQRRTTALFLLPAVSLAVLIVFLVSIQPRLPDVVATHWGADGVADGFSDASDLPWLFGAVGLLAGGLIAAIAAAVRSPSVIGLRNVYGLPNGVIWLIGALGVATGLVHVDAVEPPALPGWAIPMALGAGLIGWGLAAWAAGPAAAVPRTADRAPASAPRHPVEHGHTAVWIGSTPPAGVLPVLVAAVALLGLAVSWAAGWWLLLIFGPVVALLIASTRYRVSVGPAGVSVRGAAFGFPRVTIPLESIVSAEAGLVRAGEFGGWGIRQGLSGETAVITRSGAALVLERTDGARLRVSLDRPEEPAAVVSTLLDRR